MNKFRVKVLTTLVILTLLPYSSGLNLPNGDPAPGRSPGPPLYDDTTTETAETTTLDEGLDDACAVARIPSDSEEVVTLSNDDSEVNLTISHDVFDTNELVKGVVYDGELIISYHNNV